MITLFDKDFYKIGKLELHETVEPEAIEWKGRFFVKMRQTDRGYIETIPLKIGRELDVFR